MGIKGLSSFIGRDLKLHQNYELYDSRVVIDGGNFLYWLYNEYHIDFVHGGEYDKLFDTLIEYFEMLEKCKIEPIVIFDGGHPDYEWRFAKAKKSTDDRLEMCKKVFEKKKGNLLMPILAWDVFQNALDEKNVKYATCVYDSDSHVAALGNHFRCPVISGDNDFYIFDIKFGFIRLYSMSKIQEKNGINYLNCDMYFRTDLLSSFPKLQPENLPLFATLLGNDVVTESTFEIFFRKNFKPYNKSRCKRMSNLLHWLEGKSLEKNIKLILKHFHTTERDSIGNAILQSVHEYNSGNTVLARFLENDFVPDNSLPETLKLYTPSHKPLPVWFIKKLLNSRLSSFFLNVIMVRKINLPIQIENIKETSTFECTLNVRKIIYALCLLFESSQIGKASLIPLLDGIVEYDRYGTGLRYSTIVPKFYIPGYGAVPSLGDISSMNPYNREKLFFAILGVSDKELLTAFPHNWKFFSAVVVYWIKNVPQQDELLNAVLSCVILLSVLKGKRRRNDVSNADYLASKPSKVKELMDKLEMEEKESTWQKFQKYFDVAKHCNIDVIHSFGQLQACFLFIGYISQLLDVYFDYGMFKCLNGTYLCNLITDLRSAKDANYRMVEIMGADSALANLLTEIKITYMNAAVSTS